MLHGALACDRFHAPDPRRHAAFLQYLDQPDLAGRARVRSAAKFGREVADLDDPHLVAVLLSEQRHGVILVDRHIDGHIGDRLHLAVPEHLLVDNVLDILQLFIGDSREVRKIKAQMVGCHQRSRLLHVLPKHFTQSGMQQMRRSVIPHGGFPNIGVHDGVDVIANPN